MSWTLITFMSNPFGWVLMVKRLQQKKNSEKDKNLWKTQELSKIEKIHIIKLCNTFSLILGIDKCVICNPNSPFDTCTISYSELQSLIKGDSGSKSGATAQGCLYWLYLKACSPFLKEGLFTELIKFLKTSIIYQ